MSQIENIIIRNRNKNLRSIAIYLNGGDPSLEMTQSLITQCFQQGVDIIELGIPFPNSFTDGQTVLKSHARALANQVDFEDVIAQVQQLPSEYAAAIVLIIDFSHSVKPRGLEAVLQQCQRSGIGGTILHGLPPLYVPEYLRLSQQYQVSPIFSLYPNTHAEKMAQTISHSTGYLYLVSQYGRSGAQIDFKSPDIQDFYSKVKAKTSLPLMAGFGIKNTDDIQDIFSTSQMDGVIIGSAVCKIIEKHFPDQQAIINDLEHYLAEITSCKKIGYPKNDNALDETGYDETGHNVTGHNKDKELS